MDPNSRDMLPKLVCFFPSHHVEDAGKAFVIEALRENLEGNLPMLPQSWDCAQKLSFHQRVLIRLFKSGHPIGWGCCSSFFNTPYCPREDNYDGPAEQSRAERLHFASTESHGLKFYDLVAWRGDGTKKQLDQVLEPTPLGDPYLGFY